MVKPRDILNIQIDSLDALGTHLHPDLARRPYLECFETILIMSADTLACLRLHISVLAFRFNHAEFISLRYGHVLFRVVERMIQSI